MANERWTGGRPRSGSRRSSGEPDADLGELGVAGEDGPHRPGEPPAEAGPVEHLAEPAAVRATEGSGDQEAEVELVEDREGGPAPPSPGSPQNRRQPSANHRRFWLMRPAEQPYLSARSSVRSPSPMSVTRS